MQELTVIIVMIVMVENKLLLIWLILRNVSG